jgi:hypothetical protein
MKNITNTLTKLLAVVIFSVSLNAEATIGVPEMVPVFASKDKPLEIAGAIE